mgnify:FL=1
MMSTGNNRFYMEMDAVSENEAFARVCIAAFCARLDPTLEEINDIKTAVSEAVTNSIIHGYRKQGGVIHMQADIDDNILTICISDDGCGIEDVNKAMEPLYTTGALEERSGMGFTFMEIFMDCLQVESEPGKGTKVIMKKEISKNK